MHRLRLIRNLLAALASCMACCWIGCSGPEQPVPASRQAPIVVDVARVQAWPGEAWRRFPGVVLPKRRAVLSTRLSGTLETVLVESGDRVARGAVLGAVQSRDARAAVVAAREALAAARLAYEHAVRMTDRLSRLYAEGLIPRKRLEEAHVRQRERQAGLQGAMAEVEVRRVDANSARITAPFAGTVGEVLADQGTFIGPGAPVFVLEDRSSLRVDVPVPATFGTPPESRDGPFVRSPLLEQDIPARFVALVPALDGSGAGQTLRLALDQPAPGLRPGQAVTVLMPHDRFDDPRPAALPAQALIRQGQLNAVMAVEEDNGVHQAHLRHIQVRDSRRAVDGLLPVVKGLKPGDLVVLHPSGTLRDGRRIIPSEAPR